jgi:hypothetical protein
VAVIMTPEIIARVVEYRLSILTMAKPQGPSEFFGFPAKRIGILEMGADRKIVLSETTHSQLEQPNRLRI